MRQERHWRPYPADPSCVLYLPFYKFGSNAQKIWDQSGNNNHGVITGVTPATYPILNPVNLVMNGGFDTDVTGWDVNINCTLSSVADGQSGNGLEITRVREDNQIAGSKLTLISGKKYKFSGWVKSGTSGNESVNMGVFDDTLGWITNGYINTTSLAPWLYYETIFTYPPGGSNTYLFLQKLSATVGTILFDSISVKEIVGYEGLGWGFDGVDDTVICPLPSELIGAPAVTILVWCQYGKISTSPPATAAGYAIMCVIGDPMTVPGAFYLGAGPSLSPAQTNYYVGLFNIVQLNTLITVNPDRKLLLGLTYPGGANQPVSAYIDGEKVINSTNTNANVGSGGSVFIGIPDAAPYKWDGNIFDLIVFNRILSAQEIKSFFDLTRNKYGV